MSAIAENSHGGHGASAGSADRPTFDPASSKTVFGAAAALAVVGVGLGAAGWASDHERFAYAYLTGYLWLVTLGLGAAFFVVIQHLARAGWSVAARRQAEWLSSILLVAAPLFIPVFVSRGTLYAKWLTPAADDHNVHKKLAFLNLSFWSGRAVVYFAIWALVAWWFAKESAAQDEDGKIEHTLKMQARSAPAIPALALSLTFAAFDWVMSLDPHWYSTIFGVYVFSGGFVAALASIALLTLSLQEGGWFKKVSTVEHRHDIGKLLFGFTVFWAYIGFSQFFLIWYANIPEETVFFLERMTHGWMAVSGLLLFGHFVVPFLFLLSRHTKRSVAGLRIGAAWMLAMHLVDCYWLVMPNHEGGFTPSWVDLAGFLMPVGIGALVVARTATRGKLFPVSDPRLPETYKVENL